MPKSWYYLWTGIFVLVIVAIFMTFYVATMRTEPGEDVGGEDLDEVPQVGNVVHIGKCGGDEAFFHDGLSYA